MNLASGFTAREFRNTMGLFATGIAVVTARLDNEVYGMTVNSFTSVSIDPPLVLICVDKAGQFLEIIEQRPEFAISFLSDEQEHHSRKFARQSLTREPEEPVFWAEGPPYVHGAAGGVACTLHQKIDAGDHVIILGRVLGLWEDQEPRGALLYYRGRYQQGKF